MVEAGNVGSGLPPGTVPDEILDVLARGRGIRIERIVSTGPITAAGEWYDQKDDEFVLLVAGAARLRVHDEAQDRELRPGDWILLPAHCRHRVTYTQGDPPTVWLAVHFAAESRGR
jgi:cupin 2 domain-containing protein